MKEPPVDTTISLMQFLVAGGSLQKISDMQTKQEQASHINALELLGGKLRLLGFFKDNKKIKLVRVMDNNSTVANINYMGGVRFDLCDDIAFTIWQWAAKTATTDFSSQHHRI